MGVMETNFWESVNVSLKAVECMREHGRGEGGVVVQISSFFGWMGMQGKAFYVARLCVPLISIPRVNFISSITPIPSAFPIPPSSPLFTPPHNHTLEVSITQPTTNPPPNPASPPSKAPPSPSPPSPRFLGKSPFSPSNWGHQDLFRAEIPPCR
jgi:hypothetical protein